MLPHPILMPIGATLDHNSLFLVIPAFAAMTDVVKISVKYSNRETCGGFRQIRIVANSPPTVDPAFE